MSDKPQKPAADKTRRGLSGAGHKFPLGAMVALTGRSEQTAFKITRLLPDGGSGLQYRIKSESETYERVATESLLTAIRR